MDINIELLLSVLGIAGAFGVLIRQSSKIIGEQYMLMDKLMDERRAAEDARIKSKEDNLELKEEALALKHRLTELELVMGDMKATNQLQNSRIDDLTRQLADRDKAVKALQDERNQLKTQLSDTLAKLTDALEKQEALQAQIATLRYLDKRVKELENERNKARLERDKERQRAAELEKKVNGYYAEVVALKQITEDKHDTQEIAIPDSSTTDN